MRRFGKAEWTAATVGAALCAIAMGLPWVFMRTGMSAREAAGKAIPIGVLVAPAGLLTFGIGVRIAQNLQPQGWILIALGAVASAVNGLAWGGIAKGLAHARAHARVVFWLLVLGLGLWCTLGVALILPTLL